MQETSFTSWVVGQMKHMYINVHLKEHELLSHMLFKTLRPSQYWYPSISQLLSHMISYVQEVVFFKHLSH